MNDKIKNYNRLTATGLDYMYVVDSDGVGNQKERATVVIMGFKSAI